MNRNDAVTVLLSAAFDHVVDEPNVESGFARIRALAGSSLDDATLAQAVNTCLSASLIREPVRLPEGALQCHWRLELTPRGLAEARARLNKTE
jgi:hypothetical protein